MLKEKKGFTLIELLVVIAIIGLLASIVLINLNTARNKAKNAAIKAALSEARVAAEIVYDTGSSYATVCTSSDFIRISANVASNAPGGTAPACFDTTTAFCAQSSLNGGGFWCADNTGVSQYVDATQCIADGADCTP